MRGFGLGGRVMSRLGAETVLVPGGKIGEAFDKHQIDGAEFLTPAVDQRQRLQDHAKIIYVPGWHQPETVLELLINQEKWNALNDEQQTLLETACRSMLLTTLAESPRLQVAALAELAKQGVRIETWSDDLARAFRGAWEEVASEESSRDPFFRTVLSDIEKFRAGPEPSAPDIAARCPQRREGSNATRGHAWAASGVSYRQIPGYCVGLQIGDDVRALLRRQAAREK